MTVSQLPLTAPPHNNQQLFSDHYLNEVLPLRAEWKSLVLEALRVQQAIAAIFAQFTPSENEAQTEEELVRPVLKLLGHTFEVQPAMTTPDGTKRPDYVLYRDGAGVTGNKGKVLSEENLRMTAVAVADAKYWDRALDIALTGQKSDPFNNRNPSYQIAFYLQHSGVLWGVLTNGRRWRLYHRDSAHKLDRFYEVDLVDLVSGTDPNRFLYFYAFFRRAAFEPGSIGVQEVLQQSIDYALKVGDQLKRQVFDSLRHLAQGFLDYPDNDLTPDPGTLKEIYDNSLILLYRLLFVLYAESRELLPLRESADYRESYSLHAIKQQIAEAHGRGRRLLPTSGTRWPTLRTLFAAIDKGSPPLKVGTFNGGLFDPAKYPFLERFVVGDRHLEQAIDTIARVDGQFVDYRDLAEHHLGAIYEGLLEYHLEQIDPEDGWAVDLVNDKGERKKIGSYFTPNYIVKYIVDHTVGPVLQEVISGKVDEEKIGAILDINVLDPAMGSAYFLVEATEYIARFIVNLSLPRLGNDSADDSDLAYWKRQVVQSCIYGVDINPLAVELAKLSLWLSTVAKDRPLSFLDHHLRTGNSLIGVRVANTDEPQRQHEAGKVSAKKAAKKADAAASKGQLSMLADDTFRQSMSTAVGSMWLIEHSAGDTVEDVKEQERIFTDLRQTLTRRYERFADLLVAEDLGLDIPAELWPSLRDLATGRTAIAMPATTTVLEAATETATKEQVFHWDLEFPEVFFDRHGQPLGEDAGFDAIVGNPPYVRQERLTPVKPYLREHYRSFHSVADLYIYFFEQGIQLLNAQGRLGYITSGTFARANFAKPFRAYLPTAATLEQVIDFGENQPFKGAEMVRPTIVVLWKGDCSALKFLSLFLDEKIPASLDSAMTSIGTSIDLQILQQPEWTFQSATMSKLMGKIAGVGRPLREVLGDRMLMGVKTGLNEAFVIDRSTRDLIVDRDATASAFIHPLVTGQDLRPWYKDNAGRFLIVVPAGWSKQAFGTDDVEAHAWMRFQQRHPSLTNHLEPFAVDARKRGDKGDFWWELRSCDYYWAFETPKIIFPDIAKLPRYSLDRSNTYVNNTGYFIPNADEYLLGILQSRVIWFATSQISQPLRLRAGLWQYRLFPQFIERLPIPEVSPPDRESVTALAKAIGELTHARYTLHERIRRRLATDFAHQNHGSLNQKLTSWWTLDFVTFRAEVKKALKHDIPVRERDEWEAWLTEARMEHDRLTLEIVEQETRLNEIVYRLFELVPEEIAIIEASTKYKYGEV